MKNGGHLCHLTPELALWHAFDSKVKADLFSTAILAPSGLFLIDPIPLAPTDLAQLLSRAKPRGVIVTNSNHWRDSKKFAAQLAVPIFASPLSSPSPADVTSLSDGMRVDDTIEVIVIDGAAGGEIVVYSTANGGTLVFGDALINFEPYGFTFLPPKYCSNPKQMRHSLQKVLDRHVERLFFAHGMPILKNGSARLRGLLKADPR